MNFTPYKPKQGKYARLSVGAAIGVLLLFAAWRATQFIGLGRSFMLMGVSVPYGAIWGALLFVVFGLVALLFACAYKTGLSSLDKTSAAFVDLLIDTENELKKVSWPGREEIRRYTIVVIVCILVIGGLIYSVDYVVSYTMRSLRVLPI